MKAKVTRRRLADENNAVLTVTGGSGRYCRTPCPECPWRRANAGNFPAEAFRLSADTASDMATHTFACHMAGAENPATCAGFLLSESARDNLAVRLAHMKDSMLDVDPAGADLWPTYRKMAVANGVSPRDPALYHCMPEARFNYRNRK